MYRDRRFIAGVSIIVIAGTGRFRPRRNIDGNGGNTIARLFDGGSAASWKTDTARRHGTIVIATARRHLAENWVLACK